jgi:phytoene dehydrogenase-like protein
MTRTADVIVVGAGHNGLVAAGYLARAGLDVLVVEAYDKVGGMMATNAVIPETPDYRFNEGAMDNSLFRATTIAADLQLAQFGYREVELDAQYVFLDDDDASLCIWRDPARTADELKQFSRKDASTYLDVMRDLKALMDLMVPYMLSHPTRLDLGKIIAGGMKMLRRPNRIAPLLRLMTGSQAEAIEENFTHRMVRGPMAALPCFIQIEADATGWALVYFGLLQKIGVSRIVGGTGALTDALAASLLANGGKIRTSAKVDGLTMDQGRVTGVRLDNGEELTARAVITTCNPKTALLELLPNGVLSDAQSVRARHIPTAGQHASSLKINVALGGQSGLSRYEKRRGDGVDLRKPAICWNTYEQHVEAWNACSRGELPKALTGVTILPTGADPSQTPAGKDTLWWWTGIAAADPKESWATLGDRATNQVMKDVAAHLDNIDELEIGRQVLTPDDIAVRFDAPDGNVYHVDSSMTRFGPMRPALGFGRYRTAVPGLFLSGAGTHPSAGICGVPGQLAARVVMRELKAKKNVGRQ